MLCCMFVLDLKFRIWILNSSHRPMRTGHFVTFFDMSCLFSSLQWRYILLCMTAAKFSGLVLDVGLYWFHTAIIPIATYMFVWLTGVNGKGSAQRVHFRWLGFFPFYARKQLLLSRVKIAILSVRLSHEWISQKRCKLGSPNLHRRLPGRL